MGRGEGAWEGPAIFDRKGTRAEKGLRAGNSGEGGTQHGEKIKQSNWKRLRTGT
jgi:hypothetical protein